jgi:hypothetical protein
VESVTTTAPAGEGSGAVVVVGSGTVVGVDEGRVVLVVWPEPRGDGDVGEVAPVVGSGPLVVVVEDELVVEEEEGSEEVGAPEPVSAGAVVVVVADGSVVVVVESGAGSVAGDVDVVVELVPGSGAAVSARAEAAGTQTTAMNTVVMARPRRMRLDNTGISSPGSGDVPRNDTGSNGNAVEHIGRQRPFVTKGNVPER